MRIVCALGRKALLTRQPHGYGPDFWEALDALVAALASISAEGHQLVVTHAVGPQDGWLALQAAATPYQPSPHAQLNALEVGLVGHLIADRLTAAPAFRARVVTMLTQVKVDLDDRAFRDPRLPIGQAYGESEARALAAERAWSVAADNGYWRRMIASPKPLEAMDTRAIGLLLDQQVVVICSGAGMPVAALPGGLLAGVPAIIDNDASSALLACQLNADRLLLLTDVEGVYRGWAGTDHDLVRTLGANDLPMIALGASSMLPKVRAALHFAETSGHVASIGRVADARALLAGRSGTHIHRGG